MARMAARLDKLEAEEAADRKSATTQPAPAVAAAQLPPKKPPFEIPDSLKSDPVIALTPEQVAALKSRTIPNATLDRSLLPDGVAVELSATSDASSVSIKLARSESDVRESHGIATSYGITASAPLAGSGRFSDIGTLDGFIGGSKLRFQVSRFVRRLSEPDIYPGYDALVEITKAACRARLGATAKECAPDLFSSEFVNNYAPELETALLAMTHMTPGPNPRVDWSATSFGAEFAIGYKKFNFISSSPARKDDASRVPVSGKVYFSYLPDVRSDAIVGAVEYQRVFKDGTAGALCPAGVPGAEVQCLTGPIGDPKRDGKLLLSAEYRHQFTFGEKSLIPSLGISAMATYDALNKDFGVDVPVYLVNDPKIGLTGGLRLGYTTKDKDFVAGVFVGTGFSLR